MADLPLAAGEPAHDEPGAEDDAKCAGGNNADASPAETPVARSRSAGADLGEEERPARKHHGAASTAVATAGTGTGWVADGATGGFWTLAVRRSVSRLGSAAARTVSPCGSLRKAASAA